MSSLLERMILAGGRRRSSASDPDYSHDLFLCLGDNGTGASFVDRSTYARGLTAHGGAVNSTNVIGSGAWSIHLSSPGDYVTTNAKADWLAPGVVANTWEALIYLDVTSFTAGAYYWVHCESTNFGVSGGSEAWGMAIYCPSSTDGRLFLYFQDSGGTQHNVTSGANLIHPQTVHHIAKVMPANPGTGKGYVDGVGFGTIAQPGGSLFMEGALFLGAASVNNAHYSDSVNLDFPGYLKFRFSDFQRYTADFTPPTDFPSS